MDIRQLRHVMLVTESGSLVRAAEAMAMTQPALTKSIQRLEKELGVTLFRREALGMRPTPYALSLTAYARKLDKQLEDALADVQAIKHGTVGSIRVGSSPLTAASILPAALARFTLSHPDVEIRLRTTSENLMPGLLAGEYDFLVKVLNASGAEPGAREHLLFEDSICVVVRRSHPLTALPRVEPSHLAKYRWILPPPGNAHRRRLEAFLRSHGEPPPHVIIEASPTGVIADVTSRTDHIGLVSRSALRSQRAQQRLAPVEFASPHLSRPFGIVWKEDIPLSPSCLQLITELKKASFDIAGELAQARKTP